MQFQFEVVCQLRLQLTSGKTGCCVVDRQFRLDATPHPPGAQLELFIRMPTGHLSLWFGFVTGVRLGSGGKQSGVEGRDSTKLNLTLEISELTSVAFCWSRNH